MTTTMHPHHMEAATPPVHSQLQTTPLVTRLLQIAAAITLPLTTHQTGHMLMTAAVTTPAVTTPPVTCPAVSTPLQTALLTM